MVPRVSVPPEKKSDAPSTFSSTPRMKVLSLLFALLVGFLTYFSSTPLQAQQSVVLAITAMAVVLWVSEVTPLYITSILSSFLLIVLGGFSAEDIFRPYFDPVIVLCLGGFILARALKKFDLDCFIAYALLQRTGSNPYTFILGIMGVTAFLSMWMSNTAASAIMIPICIAVLKANGLFSGTSKFAKGCVLAVAYAATIGGITTLVGSPPNAIAVKFLTENRVELTFVGWMVRALPFVIVALFYVWGVVCLLNRPEVKEIRFESQKKGLSREQCMILGVFFLTVLGWLTTGFTGFSASTVALIPIILLYGFGLLDETDLGKISWGTLLLLGGGLSLGGALIEVKIDILVAEALVGNLAQFPQFLTILILVFLSIFITMMVSNTASAAILVPLMIPVAKELGLDLSTMAIVIAIGVSLDFIMPVGTPPNAIAYSTGLVRIRDMVKNGMLMNLGTGLIHAWLCYLLGI